MEDRNQTVLDDLRDRLMTKVILTRIDEVEQHFVLGGVFTD